MVYTDSHRWRNIFVVMLILCSATFGSLWYAGKLSLLTDFSFLKGQVLSPLAASDVAYLQGTGYSPIDTTKTMEDLMQHFIETMLKAGPTDFDKKNATAGQLYLMTYYRLSQPIPATISQAMKNAVDRFMIFSSASVSSSVTSPGPSLSASVTEAQPTPSADHSGMAVDVQNIISNHKSSPQATSNREKQKTLKTLFDRLSQEL